MNRFDMLRRPSFHFIQTQTITPLGNTPSKHDTVYT
jgi:hypothetical protein